MKKLSEEEIEDMLNSATASVEMAGLKPTPEAAEISKRYLRGEISDKKANELILKLHGLK